MARPNDSARIRPKTSSPLNPSAFRMAISRARSRIAPRNNFTFPNIEMNVSWKERSVSVFVSASVLRNAASIRAIKSGITSALAALIQKVPTRPRSFINSLK